MFIFLKDLFVLTFFYSRRNTFHDSPLTLGTKGLIPLRAGQNELDKKKSVLNLNLNLTLGKHFTAARWEFVSGH